MNLLARAIAVLLLVLVGIAALAYEGGRVQACLGGPGITKMDCVKVTGVPAAGMGLPVLALTIAVATFVVAPVPAGRRGLVLVGGVLGGAIGGAAFLVLRPLTIEGPDFRGTWLSIPRPLDAYALVTAVVLCALLGATVMRLVPGVRRVELARS